MDSYTYLHFGVGIILYYWGVRLKNLLIIHTLFEIIENTKFGMSIINIYFTKWPGGKPYSDSLINILGDSIGVIFGWLTSYYINYF